MPELSADAAAADVDDSPAIGQVEFVTDPVGATVIVDGLNRGRTPVKVDLAYGTHVVQYSKTNHSSVEETIEVTAPDTLRPSVRLSEISLFTREGEFMVFFPGRDGDTLSIDGREVGALPTTVKLTEGQHRFIVSGPGGESVEIVQQVVVGDGQGRIILSQ